MGNSERAPHRIVSLIASATEIVTALGLGDCLVGRSHECDFPPWVTALPACSSSKVRIDAPSRIIDQQVKDIVADGLSVYRVDAAILDSLEPTVIVTQTQCEVCAVSLQDVQRAVVELVRSQPRIVSLEPMSLNDIWNDVRAVAAALDVPVRGERLVDELTRRMARLRALTSTYPRPTLACIEWIDPLMHTGNWVPELVEAAGGANVFGRSGVHSGYLRLEELESADPDVIAIMPCGFDLDRVEQEIGVLEREPRWLRLRAARNQRVALVDGNQFFNRPGPRVVESTEILAEVLHADCDFGHRGRDWTWRSAASVSTGARLNG